MRSLIAGQIAYLPLPGRGQPVYTLQWKNPALPAAGGIDVNKSTAIQVPVGTVVSNKAPIRFTGKGTANYGAIQQENLMRLVENFADSTEPNNPTVGLLWFDTANGLLKLCSSTSPIVFKTLSGIQITNTGAPAPVNPVVGDMWFQRTGTSSGISYVYTGIGRYPNTATTIGGWAQTWPNPVMIAGREEYDAVVMLVNQMIGVTAGGGTDVIGKSIQNLTSLVTLDASMQAAYVARAPLDETILTPTSDRTELLVDPNSNDWDTLLAAAKYAISRLELPANYSEDISPMPFVFDGRQAPASLILLGAANDRYPSLERRSGRQFGIVTLSRLFSETVNVLTQAIASRYSLKGINGATSANPTFNSGVTISRQALFSGPIGATTAALALRFTFPTTAARTTFLNSGGAIQIVMALSGGTTTADTEMQTLLDQRGVLRLTLDKARIFANVLPYALSTTPSTIGLSAATAGGFNILTGAIGAASYTVSASIPTTTTMIIGVILTGSGLMNGTWSIDFSVIKDTETYLAPILTPVYGSPIAYTPADVTGSPSIVYQN